MYEVGISIAHQVIEPRIDSLFVGLYIMQLVRGMGILERIDLMRVVCGVASTNLKTLRSMGMLKCVHTA